MKCTNIIPVQISLKNHLVYPSFLVEFSTFFEKKKKVYLCVAVGCKWMHMNGGTGGGGGGSMSELGKSIDYLFIFCIWVDKRRLVCTCHSVCVYNIVIVW